MADRTDAPRNFTIGLTMAGSVSAGAYVAGVLDMLFRALDEHARTAPGWTVTVKAMSGTSGGGVSAALSVAALIAGFRPESRRAGTYAPDLSARGGAASREMRYDAALGILHDLWVEELSLRDAGPQQPGLLGTRDLGAGRPLMSLLDGTALDRAADRQLGQIDWAGTPHPFLADPLDLFITTTNLNGVVHEVNFAGTSGSGHLMARHGTVRHFAVTGLGGTAIRSDWLDRWRDAGIRLALPPVGGTVDLGPRRDGDANAWTDLRETAVATGAFPLGLPARVVRTRMGEHQRFGESAEGGAAPWDMDPSRAPQPVWGALPPDAATPVPHLAVDGGAINNEPFEYARFTLRREIPDPADPRKWLAPNPPGATEADRAVIMIDPFPEGPSPSLADPGARDGGGGMLRSVVGRIVGALVAQARFKPTELAAAADRSIRSRFLVAPSKRHGHRDPATLGAGDGMPRTQGAEALASGAMAGFSGFFDRRFRVHDFILGQKNCQSFLRSHFTLDAGNPLFGGDGTATGRMQPVVVAPATLGTALGRPDGTTPGAATVLVADAPGFTPIAEPEWPRMAARDLEPIRTALRRRVSAMIAVERRDADLGFLPGLAVSLALRVFAVPRRAADAAARRAEAALLRHDLLDLQLPAGLSDPGLARRIVALMIASGRARHRPADLVAHLTREAPTAPAVERSAVETALEQLCQAGAPGWCRTVTVGLTGWDLARHRPGLLARIFAR